MLHLSYATAIIVSVAHHLVAVYSLVGALCSIFFFGKDRCFATLVDGKMDQIECGQIDAKVFHPRYLQSNSTVGPKCTLGGTGTFLSLVTVVTSALGLIGQANASNAGELHLWKL